MTQNEQDHAADLQIGPTDQGNVRLIISEGGRVLNMDFTPEEAEEIAEEIRVAAKTAQGIAKK